MTEKFLCIRFYPDMSAKYTIRDREGMESWKIYNLQARGGNSLFINGEYVPTSGIIKGAKLERVISLCKEVQAEYEQKPIEIPGPQVEVFAGHSHQYNGYAGERDLPITKEQRSFLRGPSV